MQCFCPSSPSPAPSPYPQGIEVSPAPFLQTTMDVHSNTLRALKFPSFVSLGQVAARANTYTHNSELWVCSVLWPSIEGCANCVGLLDLLNDRTPPSEDKVSVPSLHSKLYCNPAPWIQLKELF